MNWEAIGAIGEIVGAIAVVATLGYLATQIRQNTRSVRASAYQAAQRDIEASIPLRRTALDSAEGRFAVLLRDYPESLPRPDSLVTVRICPLSGKKPGAACPAVVEEIIPVRDLKIWRSSECDMHINRDSKITTVVSARFKPWADKLGYETRYPEKAEVPNFRIVNPKDGAEYLRLPNLAPEYQSIRFQLDCADPKQTVHWYLNDALIHTTRDNHTFLWQVKPGNYRLKAVSENNQQIQDELHFSVR